MEPRQNDFKFIYKYYIQYFPQIIFRDVQTYFCVCRDIMMMPDVESENCVNSERCFESDNYVGRCIIHNIYCKIEYQSIVSY